MSNFGLLPQQNTSPFENAAEDYTSTATKPHPGKRSLAKAADVVIDDHCTEEDKQLLSESSSSSSLADDVISGTEPRDCLKSEDVTAYDSKSPATAPDNHNAGKQPCSASYLPPPASCDPPKQQQCLFKTPHCSISVFIYTGNLLQEKVDAIVNFTDVDLVHGGGMSKDIVAAAGPQVQDECAHYIGQNGPLNVTKVMQTSAGKLTPDVMYIIHAASFSDVAYPGQSKQHRDLRATFCNCLHYGNDVLKVKSMAIPAIGTGWHNM